MEVAVAAEPQRTPSPQPPLPSQEPDHTSGDKANGVASSDLSDAGNKFQKAISAWRNIDLTHLIPSLDSTASDLVAYQRDALVERKELAQKTKDFRKLEDAVKLTEIKALLKAYQSYIDLISNQSKSVSSSFLQVYSSFSEAPDPYPLLEASIDSLVTAEETVPRLEADNQHLQSQVAKLTSQLEDTEKRLEAETTAKKSLKDSKDASVQEVETSWSAVLTEKQDNWDAQKRNLEERAENQERLLKELKASYEVSQRLDRNAESDSGAQASAMAAELEIVTSDLERANQRLADVEARNEQFRVELAQSAGQATRSVPVEEDPNYLRLRSENSSLLRKIDAARFERESAHREAESSNVRLKREIISLKQDADSLKAKVARCADYDDVKRELEVLKSIEFATGGNADGDDENDTEEPASDKQDNSSGNQKLEHLLLARNKKLNNELTVLRVSHQDLSTRLAALQEDFSSTNMELERSRNLTAQLENDLASLQQEASSSTSIHPAMSVAPTYSSRYPGAARKGGRASPTSSIISGFDSSSMSHGDHAGSGSSILPMLTAQRDRFKARNASLEAELQKTYQSVSSLRSEVAALQKDNLNLYERTRYAASFPRSQPPAATSASGPSASSSAFNPNPSSVEIGGGADRYRSAYESSLSPFAAFRGRESARVMRRMSLPERSAFKFLRTALSTRVGRNVFAGYFLLLHVLVVWLLWADARAAREVGAVAAAVAGGGGRGVVGEGERAKAGDWAHGDFQDVG